MPKLGVEFTTGETPQTAGTSQSTGTFFHTGTSNYGPEEPTRVRSLTEVERLFAPSGREALNAKLYDACNAFFALGGQTAYVAKVSGASAKAALLEIGVSGHTKILVVTAKYKGVYGNKLKVEVVENAGKTANSLIIKNPAGEVLEQSGYYAEAKELLAWGEEHKTYVVITEGSEYSTEKAKKVEKLAATELASGVDPTYTEAEGIKAIESFPKNLGPGQQSTSYEPFKEKIHEALHVQAKTNNRFALCDIEASETAGTTAATLITNKKAPSTVSLQSYGAYFSSAVTALGVAGGTSRTIPFSAVAAGLFAKVSQLGTDNRAPAGLKWPLSPFVTGIVNTYSETAQNELNEAGINCIASVYGTLCLYGSVTALPRTKDVIFCQYGAARERMRLQTEGEEILQRFMFVTLDGRHQKRAKMQGELQTVIKRQWELESLYGENAGEAGQVNVEEPINTPTTEQNGELNAELQVRLSPIAEAVRGILISVPITESVV